MSLDDIRSLIMAENATLLDTTLQKLEGVIDARLTGQEALLMKEISALQKRAELLELRNRDRADDDDDETAAVQEAKATSTMRQCGDQKCRCGERCS